LGNSENSPAAFVSAQSTLAVPTVQSTFRESKKRGHFALSKNVTIAIAADRSGALSHHSNGVEKGSYPMSNKRLYVGNLPFDATTEDVRTAFEAFGTVHDVSLITDRETGRPRGFGFVEMDAENVSAAIEGLNNKEFGGRDLTVNEARERNSGGRNSRYSSRNM
jgi:RNA recognition motif-containing protein